MNVTSAKQINRVDAMNKTVLSRNAYASRASTSRVETAQDDNTKNVTVFDKIVMPSQDLTIGIRSGKKR